MLFLLKILHEMYSGERINTFARACDGRCSNLHGNRFNMCLFNRYSINGIDITINLFIYNAWMQYLIPCGGHMGGMRSGWSDGWDAIWVVGWVGCDLSGQMGGM